MCVVATNVAETSLTIPDIKYVVDTGMVSTCIITGSHSQTTDKVPFPDLSVVWE